MAMNGTDVLILVNTGTPVVPVYTAVGSQRDCNLDEATNAIDASSKNQRERRVLPGRYTADLSLDSLYVEDDAGYLALLAAKRDGTMILIAVQDDGVVIETFDAVVTGLTRNWPDQDVGTCSMTAAVDGAITEVGT